jgi:hypothetical protein
VNEAPILDSQWTQRGLVEVEKSFDLKSSSEMAKRVTSFSEPGRVSWVLG